MKPRKVTLGVEELGQRLTPSVVPAGLPDVDHAVAGHRANINEVMHASHIQIDETHNATRVETGHVVDKVEGDKESSTMTIHYTIHASKGSHEILLNFTDPLPEGLKLDVHYASLDGSHHAIGEREIAAGFTQTTESIHIPHGTGNIKISVTAGHERVINASVGIKEGKIENSVDSNGEAVVKVKKNEHTHLHPPHHVHAKEVEAELEHEHEEEEGEESEHEKEEKEEKLEEPPELEHEEDEKEAEGEGDEEGMRMNGHEMRRHHRRGHQRGMHPQHNQQEHERQQEELLPPPREVEPPRDPHPKLSAVFAEQGKDFRLSTATLESTSPQAIEQFFADPDAHIQQIAQDTAVLLFGAITSEPPRNEKRKVA